MSRPPREPTPSSGSRDLLGGGAAGELGSRGAGEAGPNRAGRAPEVESKSEKRGLALALLFLRSFVILRSFASLAATRETPSAPRPRDVRAFLPALRPCFPTRGERAAVDVGPLPSRRAAVPPTPRPPRRSGPPRPRPAPHAGSGPDLRGTAGEGVEARCPDPWVGPALLSSARRT